MRNRKWDLVKSQIYHIKVRVDLTLVAAKFIWHLPFFY